MPGRHVPGQTSRFGKSAMQIALRIVPFDLTGVPRRAERLTIIADRTMGWSITEALEGGESPRQREGARRVSGGQGGGAPRARVPACDALAAKPMRERRNLMRKDRRESIGPWSNCRFAWSHGTTGGRPSYISFGISDASIRHRNSAAPRRWYPDAKALQNCCCGISILTACRRPLLPTRHKAAIVCAAVGSAGYIRQAPRATHVAYPCVSKSRRVFAVVWPVLGCEVQLCWAPEQPCG
jgi:hypothetical protein